jgi:hypothetical protein
MLGTCYRWVSYQKYKRKKGCEDWENGRMGEWENRRMGDDG